MQQINAQQIHFVNAIIFDNAAHVRAVEGEAGAGRRVAGAGYAVARAGAVIILRQNLKKELFGKKNTKNAPRRIKTPARAFIYQRPRIFYLKKKTPRAKKAGEMATRAKKTAPKAAATSATAAELAPKSRKCGAVMARFGNRNAAGHGAPRGNRNAVGNRGNVHARGRPRAGGAGAEAYSVKINLAITPTQRAKLDDAAEKAGIKFADFLRKLINEF